MGELLAFVQEVPRKGLLSSRTLGDVSVSGMATRQAKRLADERKVSHVQDCFTEMFPQLSTTFRAATYARLSNRSLRSKEVN
jgi:hypothetical protein